ncbi:L,D-transpeptidase family protein [Salinarimonas rosea]|uniref:L,D-transpeptidase family protein n=1 Tax=Salinarimonas rosea TaxID=552063 RepID=UPI00041FCD84|nr:L,D-transpeptidase family protein [Salinarimonas rosea]
MIAFASIPARRRAAPALALAALLVAAPGLAVPSLAVPDLAVPALAQADGAPARLAPRIAALGTPDLSAPDLAAPDLAAPVDLPAPPPPAAPSPLDAMPEYPPRTGSIPQIALPPTIGAEALVGPMLAGRLAAVGVDLGLEHGEADVAGLRAFYDARGFAPAWIVPSREGGLSWTPAARALMGVLAAAADEGLDPAAYPAPALPAGPGLDPAGAADAEIALSARLVRYAQDARGGRLEPTRLHPLITPTLDIPSAQAVLTGLADAADPAAALAAHNPPHEGYRRLRTALAALRAAAEPAEPMVRVPPGPTLRVGARDARVPLLRARFGMDAPAETDERVYDVALAEAVEGFQRENGLVVDGVVGNQTIAALASADPARREGDLLANMERWRWLPRELGAGKAIFVNVPAYRMEVRDGGAVVHEARVIVGKPGQETPIFSDEMEYVVVSPSWTIPPSIMRNEILPGLRADPGYAAARGYEVIRNGNQITVRQPPGPRNALGQIKFMFPNGHHVYLHDTPSRGLFDTIRRAYSHGCVRVEDPFALADLLLAEQGWPAERLRALIGSRERYVHLDEPVPVHLAYFTLEADADGRIVPHEDIYGFDGRTREALGLDP